MPMRSNEMKAIMIIMQTKHLNEVNKNERHATMLNHTQNEILASFHKEN